MRTLALFLLLATPAVAQEQAIQLQDADLLCKSPEAAFNFEEGKCFEAKPGFYAVVRQVKSQDTPYTFRCVKPIDASSSACQWVMRID